MTTEKFFNRGQIIAQHLSKLALQSDQARLNGILQPANSHFRAVLRAQERLLTAVEKLIEKLPSPSPSAR